MRLFTKKSLLTATLIGLFIFSTFILCASSENSLKHGVTYSFSGGRFGDELLCYLHAKWIAYREQLPLFYKPFRYSTQLKLHFAEIHYDSVRNLGRCFSLEKGIISDFMRTRRGFYLVPYFPEDEYEKLQYSYFDVDWKDPYFRELVKEMITPIHDIITVPTDLNSVNVAIHVREGGGFDNDHTRYYAPTKLPPIDFYIEQLQKVIEMFPQKSLYCHIFTDSLNPEMVARIIESGVEVSPSNSISFKFRSDGNRHDANVLEDFFSIFNFDVLIRPQSNFSIVPSLLKDFAVMIHPKTSIIKNGCPFIDQVGIVIQSELYQNLLMDKNLNIK
jgi:hypothetical protein